MKRTHFLFLLPLLAAYAAFPVMAQDAPPPPGPPAPPSPPSFGYSAPSNEMDFSIPPVPAAEFEEPSANILMPAPNTPGQAIDQFFSTTTVITPEAPQPSAEEPVIIPPDLPKNSKYRSPKRKSRSSSVAVQKKQPTPFDSVRLPDTIYRKEYDRHNRHLPLAIWESDLQHLLAIAVSQGDLSQIRALVKRGADFRQPTASGESYLVLATRYHQVDAVRWLLHRGASPNAQDSNGLTALHYAAMTNNHRILNLLLQAGADPNAPDPQGATPAQYAEAQGALSALDVLRTYRPRS